MDSETQIMTDPDGEYCPQCGSEEAGFFCRQCGTLLRGEELVLCPRCHQVVPDGAYCNQCGQSLAGIALRLGQLALAGDAFWVTTEEAASAPTEEVRVFEPDETVRLAAAELPDWLQELPTETAPPDVEDRIYPSLMPIPGEAGSASQQRRFLILVILLAGLILLSLVFMAFFILIRGG
jgi:RNA polymerase subunit RPABC4/transcription elongation factor Spt4